MPSERLAFEVMRLKRVEILWLFVLNPPVERKICGFLGMVFP